MTPEALDALVDSGATVEMIASAWKAEMLATRSRSTSAVRMARKRARDAEAVAAAPAESDACDVTTVTSDACDATPSPPPNDIYSNPPPRPVSPKASPSTKPVRKSAKPPDRPDDVEEATWGDFLRLRDKRRAPLTETALSGIVREAEKAGWTLEQALTECCQRGWQGFKSEWVEQGRGGNDRSGRNGGGWTNA